jgi:hypothetical protein
MSVWCLENATLHVHERPQRLTFLWASSLEVFIDGPLEVFIDGPLEDNYP